MKKRLIIIAPIIAVIICAITPFTALAYTTPNADIMYAIASEEGWDASKAVALQTNDGEYWLLKLSGATYSYDSNSKKLHAQINYSLGKVEVMKFDSKNPYTKHSVTKWDMNNVDTGDQITTCTVLGTKATIYKWDSTKNTANKDEVFMKAGSVSATQPTDPGKPETPGTQHLKVSSSITSKQLSGVMTELAATLPTVLPVLVTFLAIRKAIAFTLATLRSA